ncbi:YrdB family protein [Neobacillus cucumis]|uniref:DUF2568 domain-containing protein n=1 Tax=Neobacillus cucumis TaxID=1740721 RepID=A0A2N5H9G7_9BACI|nr:YrdB family protein [Neobacillus cucumis]PLS02161.1 hypothetical protein CVD27_21220 [Neobacillus cucumis]
MEGIKQTNLGVRFLLEIIALAVLGYWGFKTQQGTILKIVLGIGTPLLLAVIWGVFGAPKAPFVLSGLPFLFLEIFVFGLPFTALILMEKTTLASLYGVMVILNLVFMKLWDQ